MKQKSSYSTLQKVLTFVMAVLVFALAIFVPPSRNSKQEGISREKENIVAHATFQGIPALQTTANPPVKLNPYLFGLPDLWFLWLVMAAPAIQHCQAFLSPAFIRKINFIFVSAQAP